MSTMSSTFIHGEMGRPVAAGDALDFGCGVGRLVLPLAKRFAPWLAWTSVTPISPKLRTTVIAKA